MMNSGRPRRCRSAAWTRVRGQDRRRRAGRGDDHVGLGERGVELAPRHDRAADVGGQRLGVGGGAAADGDPLRLLRGEVPRRQLGHLAGADDEHRRVAQVADDLARQAERRVADRHRALGQLGLAPHALAGGERGVEQAVEERAGRVQIGRGRVGLLHLAEDLRLADDERIEPGGDPEQVAGGVGFAAGVDVRPQIVGRHGAGRRQEAGHRLVAVLEAVAGRVELGPVAGREQHHFAERRIAGQRRHRLAEIAGGERQPLAQVDGRGVMADAEDQESHQSKAWLVGTR